MLFKRHSPADLERLDALPDTAGWLLLYSTEAMQRWFAARPRICLALGRVHDGVEVPCVYPDNKAAARHAAGMMHRRGRNDAVYIRERFTSLGDRVASETTVEEVVTRLLATRPRPTGIFTSSPETSLGVLCVLLRAQVRVPEEMALVAGWDDEFLGHAVPSIARYRVEGVALGRKLAQMAADLLAHGPGKARALRVVPKFVSRETPGV
jgi:DNA-binding LacI/PurR family transcriptional regulator